MLQIIRPRFTPRAISGAVKVGFGIQPIRTFRISKSLFNQHSRNKIDEEIKTLKKMRQSLKNAGLIERIQIHLNIRSQERKVATLKLTEKMSAYEEKIKTPAIHFNGMDPLDVTSVKTLKVYFDFNMDTFFRECDNFKNAKLTPPDVLLDNLVAEFKEAHPEVTPLTREDILYYYHICYDLSNGYTFLQDIKIEDSKVQLMLYSFLDVEDFEDLSSPISSVAQELSLSEDLVTNWFDIFKLLMDIPFPKEGEVNRCPISPREYNGFQIGIEAVSEQINDTVEKLSLGNFFNRESGNKEGSTKSSSPNNNSTSEKQQNNKKKDNNKPPFAFEIDLTPGRLFNIGFVVVVLGYLWARVYSERFVEVTFQKFTTDFLEKGLVSRLLVVNNKTVTIVLHDSAKGERSAEYYFTIGSVESFENALKQVQDQLNIDQSARIPVVYTTSGSTAKFLINFVPTILLLSIIYYMGKRASNMGGMGGPLGFAKSNAKKFNQETDIKVRFKDVAGMNEAKEEVMEFVKFLKSPEKYEKLGAKIPRGAILSGPPGTGKTLLAKATAGEADVPFYSVSGSEFVEMFVGVGASRVRDLFKMARENAPSIVFVDEIDAIGKARTKGNANGANDERETTLNQLLVEMDGFDTSDHVVVLAGTNRVDILDKALTRPGRFDRHITIDNPELSDRKDIFDVHLKKIKLRENVDHDLSGRLAALTPGFSGADIANVCNEAALIAARYNQTSVDLKHFELAIERVIGGIEKKSKVLLPEEKKIVAYHEAGHAICGWYLRYANPLLKVSIVPRGQGTLGYAQYLPPDQYLLNTKQLVDRMIMTLGGRVSEELFFKSVTGGAHDDFKKVTQIAQSMVLRYGMSPAIGMVNYADTRSQDNLTKPFSDETNKIIDEEIERIVSECYEKCRDLLQERRTEVELVASELLRKEFITRQDMIRLLGKRPFPENNDAFDKYLDSKPPYQDLQQPDEPANA